MPNVMYLGAALLAQPNDEANSQQAIDEAGRQGVADLSSAGQGLSQGDLNALLPLLVGYVVPVIGAVLILIVSYFVARLVSRIASSPVRSRVDETLGRFVGKLVFYTIMVFALLGVLGMFGVSITSFAAVVAAAGFAIGLAFQGTLSNFAAGVLLLVFRPFKVGDVINAAGITAKVDEIDLFVTALDTFDNRRIVVPNSVIASGTIENISHHVQRRVEVNVGVDYAASLDRTREALTTAAGTLRESLIEGEGRGYQVVLLDLGASSVNWTVRFWTKAGDFGAVKEQLTAAVKNHLDQAGIGIPFPQMDVHLHNVE